jgi:biopolymer transport protein ExbD
MPLRSHHDEMPAINLTPMIDIVFNLIIFFMVGARFTELEKKVDLIVPRVGHTQSLAIAPSKRSIDIFRDGRIALDGQPVTIEQLVARLADDQRQAEQTVLLRGDGAGAFQNVAAVLTACRQAGISELGISVTGTKER